MEGSGLSGVDIVLKLKDMPIMKAFIEYFLKDAAYRICVFVEFECECVYCFH